MLTDWSDVGDELLPVFWTRNSFGVTLYHMYEDTAMPIQVKSQEAIATGTRGPANGISLCGLTSNSRLRFIGRALGAPGCQLTLCS
jgi:hypothetical protein